MNKLRAFTLVEMMVCISMGSVLMGLALNLVHRTMHIESAARASSRVERTAAHLSRQFRHDVQRAESVVLAGPQADSVTVRMTMPEQSPIIYRLKSNRALRQQQQATGQTSQESFDFPEGYSLRVARLDAPVRAVLTLEQDTNLIGVSSQVRLHVEAVVGQLLRLSRAEEGTE